MIKKNYLLFPRNFQISKTLFPLEIADALLVLSILKGHYTTAARLC